MGTINAVLDMEVSKQQANKYHNNVYIAACNPK